MINKIKQNLRQLVKVGEKYFKTDMTYLIKGGFWLTLGQGIASLSSFFLAIAFANLLPKETYGAYKYVMSLMALFSISTLQIMRESLKRSVAQGYEGSLIPALKAKIKWGTLGAIASLALAGYYFMNNNPDLTFAFLIVAFFVPFIDTLQIYQGFLQGRKIFKYSTKYQSIINILSAIAIIGALFLTNSLFVILLVYFTAYTLLRVFVFLRVVRKFKPNKKEDPETVAYGRQLSFVKIINTLSANADKILVWHFLGAVPLAVYSFAIAPIVQIRKLSKNVTELAFPKLAQREISEIKKTLPLKIFKFCLVIIPVIIIYILIAPYFYKFIFPQYTNAVFYSQIFAIILLFQPKGLMTATFTAHSHKKKIYFTSIVMPIVRITLLLILLPAYGVLGAVSAMAGAELIGFLLASFLFRRI